MKGIASSTVALLLGMTLMAAPAADEARAQDVIAPVGDAGLTALQDELVGQADAAEDGAAEGADGTVEDTQDVDAPGSGRSDDAPGLGESDSTDVPSGSADDSRLPADVPADKGDASDSVDSPAPEEGDDSLGDADVPDADEPGSDAVVGGEDAAKPTGNESQADALLPDAVVPIPEPVESVSLTATAAAPASLNADLALAYDSSLGKLRLGAASVACPSGVTFVSVGVTSPSGALRWYKLSLQDDGDWEVLIDPADFGWRKGSYTLEGSICDSDWKGVSVGSVKKSVSYGTESLAAALADDGSKVKLTAQGGRYDAAWNVAFAVKGKNGSVQWVGGKRGSDGVWRAELAASKLGAGDFSAVGWASIGSQAAMELTSAKGTVAKAGASYSLTYDSSSGKLRVKATKVTCPSGVTFVSVGVKGPEGAQRWYRLNLQDDGSWSTTINPSDFGWCAGTYTIVGSVCDLAWSGVDAGSAKASVSFGSDSLATTVDAKAGTASVTAKGGLVARARNVAFVVTGASGTQWYQGTKHSDGTWTATFKASKIGTGNCTVQTVVDMGSATRYLSQKSFHIATTAGKISLGSISEAKIPVTVTGLSCDTGIKQVQLVASNGSTKKTYTPKQGSSGSWTASVPLSDFKYVVESLSCEVIVKDSYGSSLTACSAKKSYGLSAASISTSVDEDADTLTIKVSKGAAAYAWGVAVSVPGSNGSLKWLSASKNSDGSWTATVALSSVATGTNAVRVYANADTSTYDLGSKNYTRPVYAARAMTQRVQGYYSPTGYLLAVDTSSCNVGVYTGYQGNWNLLAFWPCSPGAWSTPTVKGVFSVKAKGYYFDSYGSRCFYYTQFYGDYLFHSVLYSPYDGSLMDGRLGMNLSHGCVRLAIENAKWIQDYAPYGTTVLVY